VSTSISQYKLHGLPDNPERFGPSLAHIITVENNQDVVLGQAWLAGPDTLITCAHVVERYANTPGALIAKFPASGNGYTIRELKIHPKFTRASDQLVRYDAAVLYVELRYPEREANPLPIQFEKTISVHQELSAVRYPVHLGQFTSSPNPLAQIGRMLGPLRKNDSFHILHDLALAPGDSGSPIFDGATVVALHCGDTATLPGLNLPTTSIRLALWIDALKELGIEENLVTRNHSPFWNLARALIAFFVTFFVVFAMLGYASLSGHIAKWEVQTPTLKPVQVVLEKPFQNYRFGDTLTMTFRVEEPCFVYAFLVGKDDLPTLVLPSFGEREQLNPSEPRTISTVAGSRDPIKVGPAPQKLYVFALKSSEYPLYNSDKANKVTATMLSRRILKLSKDDQTSAWHLVMDMPSAQEIPAFVLNSTKTK
jgi:hypothetical protein